MNAQLDLGSFTLPADALSQAIGIIGRRGSGKTHTASVLTEEFIAAAMPVVVLDPLGVWWGLRSSADGKQPGLPVTILGGVHGDVPLERTGGAIVADLVIDQPGFYVVDLSGFDSKAAERQFATDFAERLYRAAARQPRALHVVIDEADTFAPQRTMTDEARMLGAFESIARRGRARGLGLTMITQRPAVLNKNVLSQVEVMIAHQVTAPQDRKALQEWAEGHATREESHAFLESLAGLQVGEAWLWSPSWLQVFQRVQVRRRHTFDSSATPKAGEARIEPQVLAPVDLDALRQKMAATLEKARADDPRELRKRIAELERELASKGSAVSPETQQELDALRGLNAGLEAKHAEFAEELARLRAALVLARGALIYIGNQAREAVDVVDENLPKEVSHDPGRQASGVRRDEGSQAPGGGPGRARAPGTARTDSPARRPSHPDDARPADGLGSHAPRPGPGRLGPGPDGDAGPLEGLRAGARRILEELVARHPATWTRPQIGALTQFSYRGGTFQTYLGELKRRGLVLEERGALTASPAAVELLGGSLVAPTTHAAMMDRWRQALRFGNYRMLEEVAATGRDGLTRDELAQRVEMTASGGTFQTYLGILRRNGLVEIAGGRVVATDVLWP